MLRIEAYLKFKGDLFGRRFRPGQFLSQRELTEALNMPLAPIREAIRMLEQENLVRVLPQRGVHIVDVDVDLIRDAFGFRLILESAGARHFALHGSADVLSDLDARTTAMLRAADGEVTEALLEEAHVVDHALHTALIESLQNAQVLEAHRRNMDQIRLIRLKGKYTPERLRPAMLQHMAIIEALKRRDPDAAVETLADHLGTARDRALGIERP
jgi:DNA-binding GntR family transcriptional regulator